MKTESNSVKQVESEQITLYQKKTLFASTVGYALDGMDMMILGVCFSLISVTFNLSKTDLGTLTSVTLLGAVLGGILFGVLADKYGRVRVFSWTILIFSLFTGLCAISPNYECFLIFRFLSGLGLGGEFGIGMTLVSESWPKNKRSRATSIVALGFQAGIILSTLTVNFVGEAYGWRWAFAVGVLPALFVAWTRKGLKEPEIWQNLKDQNKNEIAIGKLFKTPKTTATTIGLTIACAVQNFGFYGLMVWMPNMIASELKLPFKDTVYWTISTTIGMSLGILIFGWLCDKFGRRPSYITFLLISAISIWFYFQQTDMLILIIFGSAIGFFVNGMMGGYGALLAEHYPTDARSSAENIIFNVGRGIAGISQVLIAYFANVYSISYALALLSATYLLSAAAFVFLIPETKGKALE
ncbi:MFS transporter [Gilliamella sp. B2776]|uniref:MFS transporter n=1 Tax=unclassified Gilliamella TaxID=2685620 RepID=UPI00226A093C|nr:MULTISPECIES: MFS transporter [unclassified Gilliamella]MCX8650634.1 MFS transporter [Gilliamella sp. B2779]MCX8654413.1 MFS transporter [Gilliamella sp. B2737]MCX8692501.1 MFS transporter [Gilliamella sp. B2776]MCX8703636.1 MFS transporter [Gilliamella sp. B2781]WDM19004.1 MFS transporter [Gilliamella sp. B3022]